MIVYIQLPQKKPCFEIIQRLFSYAANQYKIIPVNELKQYHVLRIMNLQK